jgi:hypothetical protein
VIFSGYATAARVSALRDRKWFAAHAAVAGLRRYATAPFVAQNP